MAPLRKADDAVEIDTTGMTIEEVIQAVCALAGDAPATAESALHDRLDGRAHSRAQVAAQPDDPRAPRQLALPLRLLLHLAAVAGFFRMKIHGVENMPLPGPVVVVCNHRSNLDPFFLGAAFPRQIHFMAKAELWKFKPLGWLIDKLGAFPVNRGEADRDGGQAGPRDAERRRGAGYVSRRAQTARGTTRRDPAGGQPVLAARGSGDHPRDTHGGTDEVVRHRLLRFPRVDGRSSGHPSSCPAPRCLRAQRAAVASASV